MLPPNIIKCLSPEDQARELAAQREAERRFASKTEKAEQKLFSAWLQRERKAGRLYFINPQMNKASTIEAGHPEGPIEALQYAPEAR